MKLFLCISLLVLILKNATSRRYNGLNKQCDSKDECIEIYQCPFFNNLLQRSPKPRPPNVIKVIRENQCGFTEKIIPKICCKEKLYSTFKRPVKKRTSLSNHKNYYLLPWKICGPLPTNSRITSGTKTLLGEFPWMALVVYYRDGGLDFRCGGTVINERYVLTAAHCAVQTMVGVRLGEHNIDTTEDCQDGTCAPPVQDFYVEKYVAHPDYDPENFTNDIALIRLASTANFTFANVQPICLPTEDAAKTNLVGRNGVISGWGVTEEGKKSTTLLKVSVPVLANSDCKKIYGRSSRINSKQICAGGLKGKDSCSGDSGGPMKLVEYINGEPRIVQFGIVSYGPRDCGTEGQPAIYTRVASYMDWILDNIAPDS